MCELVREAAPGDHLFFYCKDTTHPRVRLFADHVGQLLGMGDKCWTWMETKKTALMKARA